MDLREWAAKKEFEVFWKETFEDGLALMNGHAQAGATDPCYTKASHWLELREPLPGVRLISVEFPFTLGPNPRFYLRVWTYQPQGDAQHQAVEGNKFTLSGEPVSRNPDVPQAEWRRQLKGVQIRGFKHIVDISALDGLAPAAVGPAMREVAGAFCHYVISVCAPTARQMTPAPAVPGDSESPLTATPAPVPAATQEPDETPAALLVDLAAIDQDPRFKDLAQSMRVAVANARIGQGSYRKRMLALWEGRCAVSGCAVEEILIASHALPWSQCESATQCLDEYNGLLLSANLDRLFDKGLIAFRDNGAVLMKPSAAASDLVPAGGLRFVDPRHLPYLAWHREHFGFE